MIVSANQFFNMTPEQRKLVTEIDLTLDDYGVWYIGGTDKAVVVKHDDLACEPGTDWVEDKPL